MKWNGLFFIAGFIIFIPVGAVYGFLTEWQEPVGVVGLWLVSGMGLMVGSYLLATIKRTGPGPDDDQLGEVHEGAGELGTFAPWSWWPLILAIAAALAFLALAVGLWIMVAAAIVGVIGLVGWVLEYSLGQHAH